MINVFQPSIGELELKKIKEVFESNWIGKGEHVKEFERNFSKSLKGNPENFFSTTSCSEAIFLASRLFNFNHNDEIIIPAISFIAVANCIKNSKAKIILCDVDKRSLNIKADTIEPHITSKTKAVFITHYGGVPCDMGPIIDLCDKNNIILIEDSACSVNSFHKGKACGTFGDMGMWSFDAMKILCTGDGGMVYLKSLSKLEIAKEDLYLGTPTKAKSGLDSSEINSNRWWEFDINRPGRRAIMNNIAGAIGNVQLKKLNGFIEKRKSIDEYYREALKDLDWLLLPPELSYYDKSSYYFFWIQLEKRDELAKFLLENDVYTTFRYWPINKIPYFKLNNFALSSSDWASEHTLNLPIHQSLSFQDLDKIISLIKQFGKKLDGSSSIILDQ